MWCIMNKILKININDIIIDPARESDMISDACMRQIKMHVTGICQCGDALLIILEKEKEQQTCRYVLAPFDSVNIDELTAEISARYFAGFTMLGGFDIKKTKWALFKH